VACRWWLFTRAEAIGIEAFTRIACLNIKDMEPARILASLLEQSTHLMSRGNPTPPQVTTKQPSLPWSMVAKWMVATQETE